MHRQQDTGNTPWVADHEMVCHIVQSYGKANTAVPELFNEAINVLNERMKGFSNLEWRKEKYEFLTH